MHVIPIQCVAMTQKLVMLGVFNGGQSEVALQ